MQEQALAPAINPGTPGVHRRRYRRLSNRLPFVVPFHLGKACGKACLTLCVLNLRVCRVIRTSANV